MKTKRDGLIVLAVGVKPDELEELTEGGYPNELWGDQRKDLKLYVARDSGIAHQNVRVQIFTTEGYTPVDLGDSGNAFVRLPATDFDEVVTVVAYPTQQAGGEMHHVFSGSAGGKQGELKIDPNYGISTFTIILERTASEQ